MILKDRMINLLKAGKAFSMGEVFNMGQIEDLLRGMDPIRAELESLSVCRLVACGAAHEISDAPGLHILSGMCLCYILRTRGLQPETVVSLSEIIMKPYGVFFAGKRHMDLFESHMFRQNEAVRADALNMVRHWEQMEYEKLWTVNLLDVAKVAIMFPEYWYRGVSALALDLKDRIDMVGPYLTAEHSHVLTPAEWATVAEYSKVLLKNAPAMTNKEKAAIAAQGGYNVREAIFSTLGRNR